MSNTDTLLEHTDPVLEKKEDDETEIQRKKGIRERRLVTLKLAREKLELQRTELKSIRPKKLTKMEIKIAALKPLKIPDSEANIDETTKPIVKPVAEPITKPNEANDETTKPIIEETKPKQKKGFEKRDGFYYF